MNYELDLDFSGGPKSWFDLWHTHVDWSREENANWETKKKYLNELLKIFSELKIKLKDYPNDFQLWILIDESGDNSVYIHTKNPNADNSPLKIKRDSNNSIKDKNLREFLDSMDFEKVKVKTGNTHYYCLFDKNTGISLI